MIIVNKIIIFIFYVIMFMVNYFCLYDKDFNVGFLFICLCYDDVRVFLFILDVLCDLLILVILLKKLLVEG